MPNGRRKETPVSPDSAEVVAAMARIEKRMDELKMECRMSIYDICLGISNHVTREMDRLVSHVKRLIDQTERLNARVVALEQRDDSGKVPRGAGNIHDLPEGQERVYPGGSEELAPIQRRGARRRIHGSYRQARQ